MRLYINRPNLQHNQSMPINKKAQNWPINRLISTPDQAWVDREGWWSASWYQQSQIDLVLSTQSLNLLIYNHGTGPRSTRKSNDKDGSEDKMRCAGPNSGKTFFWTQH